MANGLEKWFRFLLALMPLWLSAILGGYFFYQARFDQSFRYYDYPWRARWITSPYKGTGTACFRKVIETSGPVQSAYIVICADNFYTLKINGATISPFFRPSDNRTWVKDQTIYTGLGYPRRAQYARIYDLRPFLRIGRNAISVMVQSDQKTPRLAVEGAIIAGFRQTFTGDDTWKAAPCEQRNETLSWTSPYFLDTRWLSAIATPERVRVPANGDYTALDTPMTGCFLGANAGSLSSETRLRAVFSLPDKVRQGWLRISTLDNYDLLLNNRYVGGTAMPARYERISPLTRRGDFDALPSTEFRPAAPAYPPIPLETNLDIYLLKNVLQCGENRLEIRLRPRELPETNRLAGCYLDARLELANGEIRTLQTDGSWQAADSATGFTWSRARVAADAGSHFMEMVTARSCDKVDAGSGRAWRLLRNAMLFALALMLSLFLFVRMVEGNSPAARQERTGRMGVLLLPSAVVMTAAYLLQELFLSSEQNLFFDSSRYAWLTLTGGIAVWLLTAVSYGFARRRRNAPPRALVTPAAAKELWEHSGQGGARNWLARYGFGLGVTVIMLVAFVVYRRGIANEGFLADEYVSMLAAHGILKRGIPIYLNTGIVYTRSALFHYLLALFMALGGEKNVAVVRLLPTLWGVATTPLVYWFGREVQGRMTGLVAAALLAFSPFWVYYCREVRFYTQFGFFTTLTFYLLLRSVRDPDSARWRVGTLLAFCAGYLSQQFIIALVPPALLVLVLSGQWRRWLRRDALPWVAFTLAVMLFDFYAYLKWCQTPLAYVDDESLLLLSFHTDSLDTLPAMLLSNFERAQATVGLLYLGGLFALFVRLFRAHEGDNDVRTAGWKWWNYLYLTSALTILINTLIAARPNTRYIVHVAPLVALTAACVAVHLCRTAGDWQRRNGELLTGARLFPPAVLICLAAVCAAPFRPLREWHATERQTNRDATEAARFIARHQQTGDKVMFFSPEIALIELGRCDYMWRPRRGSEFKYLDAQGRLAERNSHAIVIDNVDKLRHIMKHSKRLWMVIQTQSLNDTEQGFNGELNRFVNANFQIVEEPFSVEVLLWDQEWHRYRNTAREYGFDQFNF